MSDGDRRREDLPNSDKIERDEVEKKCKRKTRREREENHPNYDQIDRNPREETKESCGRFH